MLLALGAADAQADRVVANDAVQSYVNVRVAPDIDSDRIGVLRRGASAPYLGEAGRWYTIGMADGTVGYVSRDWTERVAARAPAEPAVPTGPVERPAMHADAVDPRGGRALLRDAAAALRSGSPASAYAQLKSAENDWAGDAGYDYLLGVAALDSGRPGEAIMALQRVAGSLPGFAGARMELARAHYDAGDCQAAQALFEELRGERPEPQVGAVIEAYLAACTPQPTPAADAGGLYFAVGVGYDSNANGATDATQFLGFDLDDRTIEQDSEYIEGVAGWTGQRRLGPDVHLSFDTSLSHRNNPSASFVDQTLATASGAVSVVRGDNRFSAGAGAYWTALDGHFNERSAALDLLWARKLGDAAAMQLMARAGPVRFESEQTLRDVDRLLYALTFQHRAGARGGALGYSLLGGRDLADDAQSPYSNTRLGGRITASWPLANNTAIELDLGFIGIDYNGNQDFFGVDRSDDQIVAALGLDIRDWPFARWTLRPRLRYVSNDSNVGLFDYDGYEVGFMLGRSRQ